MSMFEQARQVRGYIVLPQEIERGAVGVVSAEQRALEGHRPYMKLINVLNRRAVIEMSHTNSVATVVYHALKQQLHECQPSLQKNQDVAFGIALINFVAAGQHSKDSSFFLLSQIVQTLPAEMRPKNRRQATSCGTWVVCCILRTQMPSVSLDFRPMGSMTIVYEATALAQEYDKYITRGAQHQTEKTFLKPSPKKLCASISLKNLPPTAAATVTETPLLMSSPAEKNLEDKEESGAIQLSPLLSTCDDKTPCRHSPQLTTARANFSLPGVQSLLQNHPNNLSLPPISSFSFTKLPIFHN